MNISSASRQAVNCRGSTSLKLVQRFGKLAAVRTIPSRRGTLEAIPANDPAMPQALTKLGLRLSAA